MLETLNDGRKLRQCCTDGKFQTPFQFVASSPFPRWLYSRYCRAFLFPAEVNDLKLIQKLTSNSRGYGWLFYAVTMMMASSCYLVAGSELVVHVDEVIRRSSVNIAWNVTVRRSKKGQCDWITSRFPLTMSQLPNSGKKFLTHSTRVRCHPKNRSNLKPRKNRDCWLSFHIAGGSPS